MTLLNRDDAHQPRDEVEAMAYFHQIGRAAVLRQLDALTEQSKVRMAESYAHNGTLPVGFTAFNFLTDDEVVLRHKLLLGLMLCTDPQAEARARIHQRRAQRIARKSRDVTSA